MKTIPTVVIFAPWAVVASLRGQRFLPTAKIIGMLATAGLLGQLAGNVLFQWSLGVIGMALAVPLTLGTIILIGALLGRIFLHEPLTLQTLGSIVVLTIAIFVLSLGADAAHESVTDAATPHALGSWLLAGGVAAATLAGVAYAVLGVVIRYGVTGRASLPATLMIVGLVGMFSLGAMSLQRIGWAGMISTTNRDLVVMLLAGSCNAVAFISLTKALQMTTVVYVNALNATQATMAAVAGVIIFHEAPTSQLALGVVLTIAGLILMRQNQRSG